MINFEQFAQIELRVGTVLEAEDIEGSEKLLKLKVDLGEETPRQILSGVKQWYSPEELVDKQVIVIANLEPRTMMGIESQGMLLAADSQDGPVFLTTPKEVSPGAKIK